MISGLQTDFLPGRNKKELNFTDHAPSRFIPPTTPNQAPIHSEVMQAWGVTVSTQSQDLNSAY